jgi:hypothetical protein
MKGINAEVWISIFANAINLLRRRAKFVSLLVYSAMVKPRFMVPMKRWNFGGAFGIESS